MDIQAKALAAFEIADRFLADLDAADVEQIYLIGSHAEGTAGSESDVDFLLVGEDFDSVEDERIEMAEGGELRGIYALLNTTVSTGRRPGHTDVIFSSSGPREGQEAVLLYDTARGGWVR